MIAILTFRPHTFTLFFFLSNFNPIYLVWEDNSTNQTRKGCAIYIGEKFSAYANDSTGTGVQEFNSLIEIDLAYVCDLFHPAKRCTAYFQSWESTIAN